ncbi:MAG: HAMP domain-containing protein [Halobacteriovoraceae bacterium]|nr:HAMP domain-containing protein [Halobacteriovoraceae bacterium]MCB9095956.1 HAMP domain-containing protein [Halobacteriovoraceae bacterium]
MNLSLKNRITISFIFSLAIVLIMGFNAFFFLDSLNEQIEEITINLNNENSLTDETRISIMSILELEKKFNAWEANTEDVEKLNGICEGLQSQLQKLDGIYQNVELKKIISKMTGQVDGFRTVLQTLTDLGKNKNTTAVATIKNFSKKLLDAFNNFIELQFSLTQDRERKMMSVIRETKTNMLITLILASLGTLLISMVIPGKIALPFRKISDAIRELQDCNFDVSIYYNQNDEIGELSREINKMIANIKKFEELRADRITVEHRKFDALANMVKKNVLVANADGQLIYLNNNLYSVLNLKSDDIINKNYKDSLLPESIKATYGLALKRRSKIENEEITFMAKRIQEDEVVEVEFQGFANVIPIRGKESSLDYYIMIISREIFS